MAIPSHLWLKDKIRDKTPKKSANPKASTF